MNITRNLSYYFMFEKATAIKTYIDWTCQIIEWGLEFYLKDRVQGAFQRSIAQKLARDYKCVCPWLTYWLTHWPTAKVTPLFLYMNTIHVLLCAAQSNMMLSKSRSGLGIGILGWYPFSSLSSSFPLLWGTLTNILRQLCSLCRSGRR